MTRRKSAVVILTLLLTAAACTSDDDAAPANSTTPAAADCPQDTALSKGLCVGTGTQAEEAAQALHKTFQDDALGAVIVGVWQDGKPLLVGALGDSLPGEPATVDMHHITGNVSTAMLYTALLQQVDAGKLALTDKISKWYPDLPSADAITVEMLARSTSGYSHYPADEAFLREYYADPFQEWTTDELIGFGVAGGTAFPPGTDFLFSDTNHEIAAGILAKATGRPVAELVQEGILDRLGMKDTTPPEPGALLSPVLHSFTNERKVWEEATFQNPSWTGYVGGWGSNQDDIRTFVEALGAGTLVSKVSHEAQLAPVNAGLSGSTTTRYYAMGLLVVNGWLVMNPGLQGLRAGVAHLPEKKMTIVIYNTRTPQADQEKAQASELLTQLGAILSPDQPIKA